MFVESSSMINLTCLVAWTAKPPDKVSSTCPQVNFLQGWIKSQKNLILSDGLKRTGEPDELAQVVWLHNGSEVTYNGPRTGVSLIIDKSEV